MKNKMRWIDTRYRTSVCLSRLLISSPPQNYCIFSTHSQYSWMPDSFLPLSQDSTEIAPSMMRLLSLIYLNFMSLQVFSKFTLFYFTLPYFIIVFIIPHPQVECWLLESNWLRAPVASHSQQHLVLSVFWILAFLIVGGHH